MKKEMKSEEKIFRAAMDVFVKKGKDGAKMQEIADKAEINKAMLHYYFRNKDGLYTFVFETVLKKMFGSLPNIFKEAIPFSIALRLFIDQYIDLVESNPQIPLFVLRELGQGDRAALFIIRTMIKRNEFELPLLFMKSARKAIEKQEIRKIDPMQLMLSVMGAANYYFLAEPMYKPFLDINIQKKDFIQQRKHDIFDLVFNGIKV